jgi:hypothetical protein
MDILGKLEYINNHIKNVRRNCYKLGIRLIKQGKEELGVSLIANGYLHDNSKFRGAEFEHLYHGNEKLSETIYLHKTTNPHHPEHWNGIQNMPEVYVAEMVCDITARSSEFGTNVRAWIRDEATKRYNFDVNDETGKLVFYFLDILLEKGFNALEND